MLWVPPCSSNCQGLTTKSCVVAEQLAPAHAQEYAQAGYDKSAEAAAAAKAKADQAYQASGEQGQVLRPLLWPALLIHAALVLTALFHASYLFLAAGRCVCIPGPWAYRVTRSLGTVASLQ